MVTFLLRRLGLAAIQLFIVVTVVFAMLHLLPGDPVLVILGSQGKTDPAAVAAVRHELGLDKPFLTQYGAWLSSLAHLDLGRSLANNRPVWQDLSARLPRTLELVGVAILIAVIIGLPLGAAAAVRRNGALDWVATAFTALGISVPVYVVGTLFILLFALQLHLFPTAGYRPLSDGVWQHVRRLIMPAVTLSLAPTAIVTRMARSSMLEVLHADYVRTATAKGLGRLVVLFKHALRTALIPVITVIGLQFGTLIGGSVLVEYVFNWPGISSMLIGSITARDYTSVQGVILVTAGLFILINLIVDMVYGLVDPRIRND